MRIITCCRSYRRPRFQSLEQRIPLAAEIDSCSPHSEFEPASTAWPWTAESDASQLIGPRTPGSSPGGTPRAVDGIQFVPWPSPHTGPATLAGFAEGEGSPFGSGGSEVVSHSPFDPSADGLVTALDALQVLNHLSQVFAGNVTTDPATLKRFDVNEDGMVSPLDALWILNEIARLPPGDPGPLVVPLVALTGPVIEAAASISVESLGMRIRVTPEVQRVYASIPLPQGGERISELSALLQGGQIELSHAEAVQRLAPVPGQSLRWSFWTGAADRVVRSRVDLTWTPPVAPPDPDPPSGLLWSEDAESANPRIIDQSDPRFPLIQSTLASQGDRAFHLTHPEQNPNGFIIDQTIRVRSDTKLFFMSRIGWATSKQFAKVLVSTDHGATWPHEVFVQAGSDGSGDTFFALRQVDLSSFAGQDIRIRFLYDYNGGGRYPGTDVAFGWIIDDIQIGSEFQKSPYSIGNPSVQEQLMLEYINRARADAIAESHRLATETDPKILQAYAFFGVTGTNIRNQYASQVSSGYLTRHAQPLSFNAALLQATRLHSQDMLNNGFQGHQSSSNPPAPFRPGFSAGDRASAFGHRGGLSENIFAHGESVRHAHAAFTANWGPSNPAHADYNPAFQGQGMQNPSLHRRNVHRGTFNEVGVGIVSGTNGSIGPHVVTLNFSTSSSTYVTGVAFRDQNGNGFYDAGEGLGGFRVDVQGSPHYAITTASGGYSVPVTADGQFVVTFSSNGIVRYTTVVEIRNGQSVKVDYRTT